MKKKKKKRKPREHKQRHSPTALSPHCQETGLGLYSMGEGGRGGRGEGGAQRRSKDGTRSSIWRDEGPKPSRCALAACNVSAWLSAKPTVASAAQKHWIFNKVAVMLIYLSPCWTVLLIRSSLSFGRVPASNIIWFQNVCTHSYKRSPFLGVINY